MMLLISKKQSSIALLKQWLIKQKIAYHKHDAFSEHPVAVKYHEEYFSNNYTERIPTETILDNSNSVELYHRFLDLNYNDLLKQKKKAKEYIDNLIDDIDLKRQSYLGDNHLQGYFLFFDWQEGIISKIIGLRFVVAKMLGKEISREMIHQQFKSVGHENVSDKTIDAAIDFGKLMVSSFEGTEFVTEKFNTKKTEELLKQEKIFAIARTKTIFGDNLNVFRAIYGPIVTKIHAVLEAEGQIEIEEFPLSSYTQSSAAALAFGLGQGSGQPFLVFKRNITADEVDAAWYSNSAFLSGMPEQAEVVITSKEGKFILHKNDIVFA